ncbi:hypothetical protein Dsin_006631 [Dipteronia sinensis]|uniref:Uncharacterized protein n=1 Tax=Dipteronia sinensis TaxID=43782 RepID=A0AAE0B043_9ROSI|nr:hypothetical protein Dsin_006631 [Dipteronia sinensis]
MLAESSKPSRITLLLGSPGSGKTTLMLTLAGKLGDDLRFQKPDILEISSSHQTLGLDICADIMVGDDMRRGISGVQKKRILNEFHIYPNVRFSTDDNLGYVLEVNHLVLPFTRSKQQDLFKLLGAMYSAVLFLGANNATSMQPFFSVERTEIPVWWRWCYWASPVSWTLYGVLASQVGDIDTPLPMPGGPTNITITVKEYLKATYGMDRDFLPYVAIAHVVWVLLFIFLFAFGIKSLNFQRR